jgi:hypothetical protein
LLLSPTLKNIYIISVFPLVNCICPPGALILLINLYLFYFYICTIRSGEEEKGRCLPWSNEEEGAYISWLKQVSAAVKLSIRTFADNTLLARQARKVTTSDELDKNIQRTSHFLLLSHWNGYSYSSVHELIYLRCIKQMIKKN